MWEHAHHATLLETAGNVNEKSQQAQSSRAIDAQPEPHVLGLCRPRVFGPRRPLAHRGAALSCSRIVAPTAFARRGMVVAQASGGRPQRLWCRMSRSCSRRAARRSARWTSTRRAARVTFTPRIWRCAPGSSTRCARRRSRTALRSTTHLCWRQKTTSVRRART